jgi:penicillin-binding protein 2
MLVVDELKKNEPQLRFVAVTLMAGLCILLGGLWWVQVVSAREYQEHMTSQSSRTIRLPAVRGKILDRTGRVLAENRPSYNLSLYLDDLSDQFQAEYARLRPVKITTNAAPFWKFWSRSNSVKTNRVRLKQSEINALAVQARYNVAYRIVARASKKLGQPLTLDPQNFERAYETRRALPYPFLENLNPAQISRFEENYSGGVDADLELDAVRYYPQGPTAGHLLGYLRRDNDSREGEDAVFNYRLPDYRGVVGIEYGYDSQLRGRAGAESVLVNNFGYRQSDDVWSHPEPGENVQLTIDLDLQKAAEASLLKHQGPDARGAVLVMDARNGDVLAMVSEPAVNPNWFVNGFTPQQIAWMNDPTLRPQINRATQQNYAPGSIFKPIVALACLENGLNPNALVDNPGYVMVGRRKVHDLAAPGEYNLKLAIMHSSNTYFISVGRQAGIEAIVRMAQKFHFGERTGIRTRQETPGILPTLEQVQHGWTDGETANLSIGQGQLSVTPLQMAVAYAAIANGGTVFWPRLVARIEPQNSNGSGKLTTFPAGMARDKITVTPRNMQILHSAMLAETQEGTGQAAQVAGLQICGKTGTAQVMDEHNREVGVTTWFASFAPYENPRYAVIVMVEKEGRDYGGTICAPIAHDIYEEILRQEKSGMVHTLATATP